MRCFSYLKNYPGLPCSRTILGSMKELSYRVLIQLPLMLIVPKEQLLEKADKFLTNKPCFPRIRKSLNHLSLLQTLPSKPYYPGKQLLLSWTSASVK